MFFRSYRPLAYYYLERSGMPLHDALGVNCKNSDTTENQGAGAKNVC